MDSAGEAFIIPGIFELGAVTLMQDGELRLDWTLLHLDSTKSIYERYMVIYELYTVNT